MFKHTFVPMFSSSADKTWIYRINSVTIPTKLGSCSSCPDAFVHVYIVHLCPDNSSISPNMLQYSWNRLCGFPNIGCGRWDMSTYSRPRAPYILVRPSEAKGHFQVRSSVEESGCGRRWERPISGVGNRLIRVVIDAKTGSSVTVWAQGFTVPSRSR